MDGLLKDMISPTALITHSSGWCKIHIGNLCSVSPVQSGVGSNEWVSTACPLTQKAFLTCLCLNLVVGDSLIKIIAQIEPAVDGAKGGCGVEQRLPVEQRSRM